MLTIIAAITRDNAIGKAGDMIYHISADLKRFKALTMDHPIIMGRLTFESFPNGPLPGRRNLVVTRNTDYHPEGAETYASLADAINAAGTDAYIIGGGQIYRQGIDMADALEITEIDAQAAEADTFFPEIDPAIWQPQEVGPWLTDPRTGVNYRFITYLKTSHPAD